MADVETLDIQFLDSSLAGKTIQVTHLEIKEDRLIIGQIKNPPAILHQAFAEEVSLPGKIIPPPEYFIKLYSIAPEQTTECKDELAALRMIRKSQYFYMVPAVLPTDQPTGYRVKILSSAPFSDGYGIVMEKAIGAHLNKQFERVCATGKSLGTGVLPIVLHQFFLVWLQLFDLLKYLHDVPFFHADIKPENVIADNNSLRVIDFNAATQLTWHPEKKGTALYVPNYVNQIRRTDPKPEKIHCGYLDLYGVGITLLEVLLHVYNDTHGFANPPFHSSLLGHFEEKRIEGKRYDAYKEQM